jgi:ribosome-associated protein
MQKMTSQEVARRAAHYALTKKAENITLIDLKPVTSMADYFVVCHGQTDIQVKAIADAIIDGLRGEGERPWHKEGLEHCRWVLLDFVDVVVHIFLEETREFYGLERLWGDAPQETILDDVYEN